MLLEFGPPTSSSESNLNTNPNPTQALIQAIDEYRRSSSASANSTTNPPRARTAAQGILAGKSIKEEEYFLALIQGDDKAAAAAATTDGRQVVRILSGDPARGAMSLEMEQPLRAGWRCQVSLKRIEQSMFGPGTGVVRRV